MVLVMARYSNPPTEGSCDSRQRAVTVWPQRASAQEGNPKKETEVLPGPRLMIPSLQD